MQGDVFWNKGVVQGIEVEGRVWRMDMGRGERLSRGHRRQRRRSELSSMQYTNTFTLSQQLMSSYPNQSLLGLLATATHNCIISLYLSHDLESETSCVRCSLIRTCFTEWARASAYIIRMKGTTCLDPSASEARMSAHWYSSLRSTDSIHRHSEPRTVDITNLRTTATAV